MIAAQLTLDIHSWSTEIPARAKWCLDRFGDQAHSRDEVSPDKRWYWDYQFGKVIWYFASEEDMMEFAMVWL